MVDCRLTVEEFLSSIDEYLTPYARALRENGFTSSNATKYLTEQDLTSFRNVSMPEGHKRLIMNMVSKLRTPERLNAKKRKELPWPGLSPEITHANKKKDFKLDNKGVQSDSSHSSTSDSLRTVSKSRKSLDLMSPAEKYVRSKEEEVQATRCEIGDKSRELDEMFAQVKSVATTI